MIPNTLRSNAWIAVLCVVASAGCASSRVNRAVHGGELCAVLDSSYAHAGFATPIVFAGKAIVDANQYRVRAAVRMETEPTGSVYLEFTSSMMFGNRIEDFFCSIVDDTLRIVDRERGQFFEGEAAEDFLREQLSMDFSIRQTLDLALGGHPDCDDINGLDVRDGGDVITGMIFERAFRIELTRDRRLEHVSWPVPEDPAMKDVMEVDYEWAAADGSRLERMTVFLEKREWRCKLIAITN